MNFKYVLWFIVEQNDQVLSALWPVVRSKYIILTNKLYHFRNSLPLFDLHPNAGSWLSTEIILLPPEL